MLPFLLNSIIVTDTQRSYQSISLKYSLDATDSLTSNAFLYSFSAASSCL